MIVESYHLAIATAWSNARREKSEKSIGQRIRRISIIGRQSFFLCCRKAGTERDGASCVDCPDRHACSGGNISGRGVDLLAVGQDRRASRRIGGEPTRSRRRRAVAEALRNRTCPQWPTDADAISRRRCDDGPRRGSDQDCDRRLRLRYKRTARHTSAALIHAAMTATGYAKLRGNTAISTLTPARIAPAARAMCASTGSSTRRFVIAAVTVLPIRTAPATIRPPLPLPRTRRGRRRGAPARARDCARRARLRSRWRDRRGTSPPSAVRTARSR